MTDIKTAVQKRIFEALESEKQIKDEDLRNLIDKELQTLASQTYLNIDERLNLSENLFNTFRGLGILDELVHDNNVSEIMINSYKEIYIERNKQKLRWEKSFSSDDELSDVIQKIVSSVNRVVNTSEPIVDARLKDGSRVNVILPPIAIKGACVTIRKFPEKITMEKLLAYGSLTLDCADFLHKLVESGYNIFIAGGTNSGKTTFLSALCEFIPEDERVITIEDSAEIQITHIKNLVSLETRNANSEGRGEVPISALIKASLRMNPDRIIVGEVRGAEALDMLTALNTGHSGSLSTGHANSARDSLTRLETMVLQAVEFPLTAIRNQIVSAIDIIIFLKRLPDKKRIVSEIIELGIDEKGNYKTNTLYTYGNSGLKKVGELIRREKLETYYGESL